MHSSPQAAMVIRRSRQFALMPAALLLLLADSSSSTAVQIQSPVTSHGVNYECAGSNGDFMYWEWEDPNGLCRVELTGQDLFTAIQSIGQVGCTNSVYCIPDCEEIEEYLEGADIYEWTGWWDSGAYNWDARYDPYDKIGFHWPYLDDVGLWAHEGSHGWFNTDETDAVWFQTYCPGSL